MLDGFWANLALFLGIMTVAVIAALSLAGLHDISETIETSKEKYIALMYEINKEDSWRREDIHELKADARRYRCKQLFFTFLLIFIILLWIFGITLIITISKNLGGK